MTIELNIYFLLILINLLIDIYVLLLISYINWLSGMERPIVLFILETGSSDGGAPTL